MHTDDQDDDLPPTLEELREQYARERRQLEAEMAERAARIDSERIRAETRTAPAYRTADVTKGHAAPARRSHGTDIAASMTNEWAAWIERHVRNRIDRHAKNVLLPGIADVLVAEEKARIKTDADLQAQIAELKTQVAELTERLEAAARAMPLRAVG